MHLRAFVRSIRHPAYTGRSRSFAVTVANLLLLGLAGLGLEALVPAGGVVLVVVGLLVLVVRGYAIPGTPTLLRAATRALEGLTTADTPAESPEFDPHRELQRAGVVLEVDGEFRATADFGAALHERFLATRGYVHDADALAGALRTVGADVELFWHDGLLVGVVGTRPVARWLSRSAFVADVAAITELSRRHPGWAKLPPTVRGAMLNTLRLYLDTCPTCDGEVEIDRVPSRVVAGRGAVVAATCTGCDARLFESGFDSPLVVVDDSVGSASLVGRR